MVKTQINKLLNKEMSRKEFLQHIGSGILIMLGVSGLMKALLQSQPHSQSPERDISNGYGSSAYGR